MEPDEIAYALERVTYTRTGIILDTGHVINTNQQINSEAVGIDFIIKTVQSLGEIRRAIRGVHLTRSLSADYVTRTRVEPPPQLASGNFWDNFSRAIDHVRQIDQHDAFTDSAIVGLFDLIAPEYVTYEFTYASREEWLGKIRRQHAAMTCVLPDRCLRTTATAEEGWQNI